MQNEAPQALRSNRPRAPALAGAIRVHPSDVALRVDAQLLALLCANAVLALIRLGPAIRDRYHIWHVGGVEEVGGIAVKPGGATFDPEPAGDLETNTSNVLDIELSFDTRGGGIVETHDLIRRHGGDRQIAILGESGCIRQNTHTRAGSQQLDTYNINGGGQESTHQGPEG